MRDKLLDQHIADVDVALGSYSALRRKVSRERVGKELEGMLSGKHAPPGRALDAIARLHLAGSVFAFPGTVPGDRERVGSPVRGRILGVEYPCVMGASSPAGADEDADNRGDNDGADAAAELAARHRARGWEESRLLLSALPILIKGQVDEREKLATTARPAGWHGEHADVLASPLTSVDHRLLDHSSKKFRVEN